jgi:ribose transport system substrate-binding protein
MADAQGHNEQDRTSEGVSRRDVMRWAIGVGAAVPLSGLLTACGSSSTGGKGLKAHHTVMNSFFALNNVYYLTYNKSSRAAMKVFNTSYQVAVSNNDQSAQRAALSNAGSQNINGVTMISSSEGIEPQLLTLLNKQKIYTCNMWNNAPWSTPLDIGPYYLTYGVVNGPATFEKVASLVFEKIKGRGQVIQINGIPGASIDDERLAGVAAAAKKFPNVDIVATRPGGWSRDQAQPVIQDLLTQYPNVKGIISHNDDMSVAIVTALRQKGLAGKVVVGSGDAVPEILPFIESGEVYCSLATHPGWLGGHFVARLWDAFNGWKPTPAERMIHWGCFVINSPAAAREYNNLMYKGSFPYDWRLMSQMLNPHDWNPQNLIVPFDPNTYWAYRISSKPSGYQLPSAYQGDTWKKDVEATTQKYAQQLKTDPLKKVRALCTNGAGDLIA